jgi:hypothetical protein
MQRALWYDGLLPNVLETDGKARMGPPTFDELRQMKTYVHSHRTQDTPFDIVVEGATPGDDRAQAAGQMRAWEDAGATWWIESNWTAPDLATVMARIKQGPPRL